MLKVGKLYRIENPYSDIILCYTMNMMTCEIPNKSIVLYLEEKSVYGFRDTFYLLLFKDTLYHFDGDPLVFKEITNV